MENEKMNENEPNSLPAQRVQPKLGEPTLAEIANIAQLVIQQISEGQIQKQRLENEIDLKIINEESKHRRIMTYGFFSIMGISLLITCILLIKGQDQTAMDFIKLLASIGGALFGGYGWAMNRRYREEA